MKNTKRKREPIDKGITLIALVITIIVLLILAGVTISALSGDNGILQNAARAKEETEKGNEKDQIGIAVAGTVADNEGGDLTEDKFRTNLVDRQGNDATVTDEGENLKVRFNDSQREYLVNKSTGEITFSGENTTPPTQEVIPGVPVEGNQNYKGATIPDGFKVSTNPNEQDVNKGLVVIAPDDSEFVWIPVNKDNLCAAGVSGKEIAENVGGNYKGNIYKFDETGSNPVPESEKAREPDIVIDYDNDTEDYLKNIGLTQESFSTQMQTDYNDMINSIKQYGGFYIGRYETSMSDATADKVSATGKSEIVQSKKGVLPVSAEYNSQSWYGLYEKQRSYAEDKEISDSVKSSMIWTSQHHAMLNWALQGSDADKVTGDSVKHGPDPTGTEIDGVADVINNIYDLGNNLFEWTLGAKEDYDRIFTGSNYEYEDPPSDFHGNTPYKTENYYGTRLSLYINIQ